jgi:hypothetical protein
MPSTVLRRSRIAGFGAVAVFVLAGATALPNLDIVSGCIRSDVWPDPLVALHVGSDGLIALAYLAIPGSLLVLRHRRDDIPVDWITMCFAAFILLCGFTHVMDLLGQRETQGGDGARVRHDRGAASIPRVAHPAEYTDPRADGRSAGPGGAGRARDRGGE